VEVDTVFVPKGLRRNVKEGGERGEGERGERGEGRGGEGERGKGELARRRLNFFVD
jgi:hypothetical protein